MNEGRNDVINDDNNDVIVDAARREDAGVVGVAPAPCDARIVLIPRGQRRSGASCAEEQLTYLYGRRCPLCSSTIIAPTFSFF